MFRSFIFLFFQKERIEQSDLMEMRKFIKGMCFHTVSVSKCSHTNSFIFKHQKKKNSWSKPYQGTVFSRFWRRCGGLITSQGQNESLVLRRLKIAPCPGRADHCYMHLPRCTIRFQSYKTPKRGSCSISFHIL